MYKDGKNHIIGLIGGTSWVSTIEYYRLINEQVNRALGGLQYARCIIYSLNYGEIDALNQKNDPERVYPLIRDAAESLAAAGATCLALCANTLHQYAERIESTTGLPLIHIADATASVIKSDGFSAVGLMGTRQTMEMDFYKHRLRAQGIEVLIPSTGDRDFIEHTIRAELVAGIINQQAASRLVRIISGLQSIGAQGVILGCTELPLLLTQDLVDIKLYDTLLIHTAAITDFITS